jgi:DNA-binding NarL/FixJ family response regulator
MSKPTGTSIVRILIIDDHPVVREGLAQRIARQPGFEVCGETGDFSEALQLVGTCKPDVAIVDLSLKSGHGLDLVKRIKARNPEVRMLVWSMHPESLYAERALRAGAMGYLTKEHGTQKIIEAINCLLEGDVYLSDPMAQHLLNTTAGDQAQTKSLLDRLSDRELETFELLGQGLNTAEIAAKMSLSPKTVETFRARIKDKLHLKKRTELLQRAMQWVMENR